MQMLRQKDVQKVEHGELQILTSSPRPQVTGNNRKNKDAPGGKNDK